MSARKKTKRNMGKKMNTERKNKVELINEEAIKDAILAGDKTCMILHATGGYKKFSLSRIQAMGGTQSMWNIISETLRKACTEETVKKDA